MRNDEKRTLTTGDIARYCQVTTVTVFNWIKAGKLKSFTTVGGHNRILPEDFRAFLAANFMQVPPDLTDPAARRLLVVDDERAMLDLVSRLVTDVKPSIKVDTALNGYEACLRLGRAPARAAIVDLRMPGMDGFELCKALRATPETRAMEIIVCSGFRDDQAERRLAKLGVTRFLDKPFTPADIERLVHELFPA